MEALELSTNGDYRISQLRPGVYRVQIEAMGFKKSVFENVELKVGAVVRLNVELEVGTQAEHVTVQAQAPAQ